MEKNFWLLALYCLVLSACATSKQKSKSQQETQTNTVTETVIHERVDTVLVIPPSFDSAVAALRELQIGVQVGQSTVRYDTISGTVYLNTPIKYIPYYINRDIKTTIKQQVKTKEKSSEKAVKRALPWWLVPLIVLALVIWILIRQFLRKRWPF